MGKRRKCEEPISPFVCGCLLCTRALSSLCSVGRIPHSNQLSPAGVRSRRRRLRRREAGDGEGVEAESEQEIHV